MDLPKEAIIEFQELYLEEYGISLSFSEAKKFAYKLMALYRIVVSPDEESND